jgi:hypothetical protein
MKITLNTVPFLLIASSEMVWDIGTKVVAATSTLWEAPPRPVP